MAFMGNELFVEYMQRQQMVNGAKRLVRKPYDSEIEFFKKNPNVAGYAAPDDRIVMNPYSKNANDSVLLNEAARIWLRKQRAPQFKLTPQQQKHFVSYGSDDDIRSTIAARVFSGDPSAQDYTSEQKSYVDKMLKPGLIGFLTGR